MTEPTIRESLHDWTEELEEIKLEYENTKKRNQQILDRKRESVEKVRSGCAGGKIQSEMDKLLSGKVRGADIFHSSDCDGFNFFFT